jgi:hypothetical protein
MVDYSIAVDEFICAASQTVRSRRIHSWQGALYELLCVRYRQEEVCMNSVCCIFLSNNFNQISLLYLVIKLLLQSYTIERYVSTALSCVRAM